MWLRSKLFGLGKSQQVRAGPEPVPTTQDGAKVARPTAQKSGTPDLVSFSVKPVVRKKANRPNSEFEQCIVDLGAYGVISEEECKAAKNLKSWQKDYLCAHKHVLTEARNDSKAIDWTAFSQASEKFLKDHAGRPEEVFQYCYADRGDDFPPIVLPLPFIPKSSLG